MTTNSPVAAAFIPAAPGWARVKRDSERRVIAALLGRPGAECHLFGCLGCGLGNRRAHRPMLLAIVDQFAKLASNPGFDIER